MIDTIEFGKVFAPSWKKYCGVEI